MTSPAVTGAQTSAPVPTLRPADLGEARDAVRDTPGALLFAGGGTKSQWGARPERVDAVVSTAGLDALVDHSAGDMVAVVGAGLPLARLQASLAGAGQWLALDPPHTPDGATLGGLFAANDAGPRRQRYGSLRDLVIGVTVVLADGSVGRGGGRVVKNVAGFDLMRLLCGSLGTLGLVTELVVRLHPLPESGATLRLPADPLTATALTTALLASTAVPSAMEAGEGALWVRIEGRQAGVGAQTETVHRLARDLGVDGVEELTGDDEARAWERLTAAHGGGAQTTTARAATLPDRLAGVARALEQAAGAVPDVQAELVSSAGIGLHTARLRGGDPAGHAAVVAGWRRGVAALGGTVVLRDRVDGVDASVDPWLDPGVAPPSALPLMRRMKHALDPQRRCAPGRFLGGL